MYSTRILNLLVVALSFLFVAQASWIDANVLGRHEEVAAIEVRADSKPAENAAAASDAASSTAVPTTSTSATSTSAAAKTTTSEKPETTTSEKPVTTTSSSIAPVSTTTSSSTPPPTSSSTPVQTVSSSTSVESTSTSSSVTSQGPQTTVVIVTATDASGNPTGTYTTATTSTPSSGLDSTTGDSTQDPGMSDQTKKIIIGVVCGVGGAIVVAGLAFIAWRIWGRKKNPEESDGLMSYNNGPEKSEVGTSAVGSSRSPFQSTLESYHAPTQVNQASNF